VLDEANQVGHVLRRNILFQTVGHERNAVRAHLLDLLATKYDFLSLSLFERDRGRCFRRQYARVNHAIQGSHRVAEVVGIDRPVWLNDVHE